jgi:hypothetical protein
MCVTAINKTVQAVPAYFNGDAVMDIKVSIPVYEVDDKQVDNVDLTITYHNLRRDFVIIQKGGVSLTVSSSDLERALQAVRLAHKI